MKKILTTMTALALCMAANAQSKVVKQESFSDTQARMVEVTAKSYVRPLIVDLVVEKGTKSRKFNKAYARNEVLVGMEGNPDNLRSRAIYDAAAEWNCDAIVAATFKIELSQDGNSYNVEMKGFPANFDPQSWSPIRQSDYEWLRLEKSIRDNKDLDNTGSVITRVKK